MKCDGRCPVCGPCDRIPRDERCTFDAPQTKMWELREPIVGLQSRPLDDRELYTRAYACNNSSFCLSGTSTFEVPLLMQEILLQSFLSHASQFGFFLDADIFYNAVILPLGNPHRPPAALLCAAFLWGAELSPENLTWNLESDLFHQSQRHLAFETSVSSHLTPVVHTIQAHILLATYLLRTNNVLQADFRANGAATNLLRHGLHKIRTSRAASCSGSQICDVTLPMDSVEEGERIRCFWAVAFLQMTLGLDFNFDSLFSLLESFGAEIDTPWPLEIAD
ncbi:hypothetical protein B0H16DRAFT_1635392 [Mycena metata]|uniref:Transcription factor domain-containing protein n=1 Tax=Mycena metata TaxID=1033252 RepID=A0AAD7GW56_9AGAR|nr:hypothetical protein B0H16DRAFT_1635392 [Mycena metata]